MNATASRTNGSTNCRLLTQPPTSTSTRAPCSVTDRAILPLPPTTSGAEQPCVKRVASCESASTALSIGNRNPTRLRVSSLAPPIYPLSRCGLTARLAPRYETPAAMLNCPGQTSTRGVCCISGTMTGCLMSTAAARALRTWQDDHPRGYHHWCLGRSRTHTGSTRRAHGVFPEICPS